MLVRINPEIMLPQAKRFRGFLMKLFSCVGVKAKYRGVPEADIIISREL